MEELNQNQHPFDFDTCIDLKVFFLNEDSRKYNYYFQDFNRILIIE